LKQSIVFGNSDIFIYDSSDQNNFSFCDFGNSYEAEGMAYGAEEAKMYLAGAGNFMTEEIEVF
jgi:hypothetical protein